MTTLSRLCLPLAIILTTFVVFVTMVGVNELIFNTLRFVPGIDWVYLPAGVRLLATLLFGGLGALGLLLAAWFVNFFYYFPHDFSRAFMGGLIAAVAPYSVYVMAQRWFGLQRSLVNLSGGKLLRCIVVYSLASPLLHHIWFHLQSGGEHGWSGFFVMAVGDFLGTILVFYVLKQVLNRWGPTRPPTSQLHREGSVGDADQAGKDG